MVYTSKSSHLPVNAHSVRANTLGDASEGQLALSEDPALLGALLSSSPLGIACITQNGELLYGNEKLREILVKKSIGKMYSPFSLMQHWVRNS